MKLNVLSWPFALVVFALAQVLYFVMILWSIPHLRELAGGLMIFDMRPMGYDQTEASALLMALGEAGRAFYQHVQLVLDGFYPALMGLYGWLMLRLLAQALHRVLQWLAWIPVLGATADYAENLCELGMLQNWQNLPDGLVTAAAMASRLKSVFTSLGITILLAALVVLAIRQIIARVRAQRRP